MSPNTVREEDGIAASPPTVAERPSIVSASPGSPGSPRNKMPVRVFMKLRLKPKVTPCNIVMYYMYQATTQIAIQFMVLHVTYILREKYHIDEN